ncbi:Hsp20/alpha crystallin family protein [Natronobacterium gregoryi]|uniref:GvpH protein n=2 Tax=Natronobacterium gregoryi TaxID=44930 RepID=L0AMD7_NATGS|nr:Hsp20/alpha crystallin family protein [Natronobacterium gregoryi]AFZ74210.1 GvpH protein [Natronobacterium gregoryi SP2]ELY63665.1 hypothetical protein C490_15484 [Natronobacterium gregoryi SP2]PLK22001.1 hypothetical protein CYV19_00995 [Natronobacterium gregoryi SP2]SFI51543.1 hypothetical protein SAMN05443661_10196 [Natronobacterium gregoryi]
MIDDDRPDDGEPPDEQPETEPGERHDWLSSLLSALETLERRGSASGRRATDRTVLDYDISVRSSEDDLNGDSRFEGDPLSGGFDDRSGDSAPDRDRPRRRRSAHPSRSGRVTTRQYDDELLVTADVSGTNPDDVTVGFDDSALVVALSGRELDRVEVPWERRDAEATVKNGVLTVVIEPESDGETVSDQWEDDDA